MKARLVITHPIKVGITLKITALKMIKLLKLSTLSRYLLQQAHHHFQHHLMQDHVTGLLASAPARCRCSTSMEPARDWLCTLVHRPGLLPLVKSLTAWHLIGPGWQDICRLEQYTPSPECPSHKQKLFRLIHFNYNICNIVSSSHFLYDLTRVPILRMIAANMCEICQKCARLGVTYI